MSSPPSTAATSLVESSSVDLMASGSLRINPRVSRSRTPSLANYDTIRPAPPRRTTSNTTYVNVDSLMEDDVFANESSPLLKKHVDSDQGVNLRSVFNSTSLEQYSAISSITDGGDFNKKGVAASRRKSGFTFWMRVLKIMVLLSIAVLCCVLFITTPELTHNLHEVIVSATPRVIHSQKYEEQYPILHVVIKGPFSEHLQSENNSIITAAVLVTGYNMSDSSWLLDVNESALTAGDLIRNEHDFHCSSGVDVCNITVHVLNNATEVPLVYMVNSLSKEMSHETLYAALILIFVYVLIIFELVHRTLAAMIGALVALAVLAALNQRPTSETIIHSIDMETLMLLFGMMISVAVLSETGIFDYSALKAYQLAKGKVWPLVTLLCLFSAVVSAFLDNVTTILLLTPVTIRLCEVLHLEPRIILIAEVLFSNIGGTATAIGDPPNVIIVGNLEKLGVTFSVFTLHMAIGIVFVTIAAYVFLRLFYRNMEQLQNPIPPDIAELQNETEMWRRAAARLVVVTQEESVMRALFLQKAAETENNLNKTLHRKRKAEIKDINDQLRQLEMEYKIKDWWLLLKCGVVLTVVIIFFFMYSFVTSIYISIGWIAVLGAILLLILADTADLDSVFHKVEWSTLLFFAALFILMEALTKLKLISWIGDKMSDLIVGVDKKYQLTAALVIITWVSALASSFIDNIPYTTAMVPVLKRLSEDPKVGLPIIPLVLALAFGACLGGNGTLIGASANVVCAGIAEQHGYGISFRHFFKIGFPMMLVTVVTSTVYLLICHSAIGWNH